MMQKSARGNVSAGRRRKTSCSSSSSCSPHQSLVLAAAWALAFQCCDFMEPVQIHAFLWNGGLLSTDATRTFPPGFMSTERRSLKPPAAFTRLSSSSSSCLLATVSPPPISTETDSVDTEQERKTRLRHSDDVRHDGHHSRRQSGYSRAYHRLTESLKRQMPLSKTSTSWRPNRQKKKKAQKEKISITSMEELEHYFADIPGRFRKEGKSEEIDFNALLQSLHVQGDTQMIGDPSLPDAVHPVVQFLHERKRRRQVSGQNADDGKRVALCIEGGGMRGCISAGMVVAVAHLGLDDVVDVVYGASAGTVIGAYFITKQLPHFGPEIYYDALCTAGSEFIDSKRLLRAVGLGLLDPRLYKDVAVRRSCGGKPVLNLDYLLHRTAQVTKPLDWDKFEARQAVQPLKLVTSGLRSEQSVVLDYERGSFRNMEELAHCMHASCLLPGIAGPVMNIQQDRISLGRDQHSDGDLKSHEDDDTDPFVVANNLHPSRPYEPLGDALVYEPIPYRSALQEGATHVVVLRTRADGKDVTGKSSWLERRILHRFFMRKNSLHSIYQRMKRHFHKRLYAQDILFLNQEAQKALRQRRQDEDDVEEEPHVLPIAVSGDTPEISRLETSRDAILSGVRHGFARAYDALVENVSERGRGMQVAMQVFPDTILDYDPMDYEAELTRSALDCFMEEQATRQKFEKQKP